LDGRSDPRRRWQVIGTSRAAPHRGGQLRPCQGGDKSPRIPYSIRIFRRYPQNLYTLTNATPLRYCSGPGVRCLCCRHPAPAHSPDDDQRDGECEEIRRFPSIVPALMPLPPTSILQRVVRVAADVETLSIGADSTRPAAASSGLAGGLGSLVTLPAAVGRMVPAVLTLRETISNGPQKQSLETRSHGGPKYRSQSCFQRLPFSIGGCLVSQQLESQHRE